MNKHILAIIKLSFVLIFLVISLFNTNQVYAASNSNDKSPIKVWVDTYLFDIDDFDLMKGSYEMVFYLGAHCEPSCKQLHFELINGKEESREIHEDSAKRKYYRITARLSQDLDFHQYPFEKHNLHIIVEDKFLDKDKLIFLPHNIHSGINKKIDLLGWDEEPVWTTVVSDFYYPNYDEKYSRYEFTVQLARPVLAGILKNIVPGVFIMLVGFLTMFLRADKAVNGLAMVSGALISMILLHLADISSIPENAYMTYLDGFMVINYLGLLLLLAQNIALINSALFTPIHHSIFKVVSRLTPVLWLALQVINCLVFFVFN